VLAQRIPHDPYLSFVDSFPVPVCRFARASRCRFFGGVAGFGYDEVAHQTYSGLWVHVRLAWPGVWVNCSIAPADISDIEGAQEVLAGACDFALADRNYWSPDLFQSLRTQVLWLSALYKSTKREKQPWLRWLTHTRCRIETVFGQLVERFHAKRV